MHGRLEAVESVLSGQRATQKKNYLLYLELRVRVRYLRYLRYIP